MALAAAVAAVGRGVAAAEHKWESEHGTKMRSVLIQVLIRMSKNLAGVRGDTLAIILLLFSYSTGRSRFPIWEL